MLHVVDRSSKNVEYSEVVKMSGMQILNIMALIYILTHMRGLKYFDPRIRTYYYPSLIDLCSSAVCYDCARTLTVFNGRTKYKRDMRGL